MKNFKINLKGLMLDLEEIKEIKIEDWSEYVAGKSSNGGNYITGTSFIREGSGWSRIDWSSCELLDSEYSKSNVGEMLAFLTCIGEDMEISIY